MTTFKDAVRQVFPHAEFADEPGSATSDTVEAGKRLERGYTALVDALRMGHNPRLAMLGRNLWDIVHHRHVHTLLHGGVPVITYTVAKRGDGPPRGFLMFPPQWLELVTQEPLMAAGSVIFTGSQAVDYYNDRLSTEGSKLMLARAFSYEAELLKAFRQEWPLNEYQKVVLRDFPEGFDAKKYGYEYRPVAPEPS